MSVPKITFEDNLQKSSKMKARPEVSRGPFENYFINSI